MAIRSSSGKPGSAERDPKCEELTTDMRVQMVLSRSVYLPPTYELALRAPLAPSQHHTHKHAHARTPYLHVPTHRQQRSAWQPGPLDKSDPLSYECKEGMPSARVCMRMCAPGKAYAKQKTASASRPKSVETSRCTKSCSKIISKTPRSCRNGQA